jgi:hypothetical protein
MTEQALLQRFNLTGKTAAITGAGGELCGAMAQALGAVGVKVAILDISPEKAEVRAQSVIRSGGIAKALGRVRERRRPPLPGDGYRQVRHPQIPARQWHCHQVRLERFSRPGWTLLGGDSHTPPHGTVV